MSKMQIGIIFDTVSTEALTGLVADVMPPSKFILVEHLKMTPEILVDSDCVSFA